MNNLIYQKNLILFKYLTYQELYIIYFNFLNRINICLNLLNIYIKNYKNTINEKKLYFFSKWLLKIKKAIKKNYFYF
jgi:hypothetical protein